MNRKNIKIHGFVLVLAIFSLAACKKDKKDVTPSDSDVFVSITGAGNINNTMDVTLSNAAITAGQKVNIGAVLTKVASAGIKAVISVDTSLYSAYKTQTSSNYRLLPSTSYTFTSPSEGVTINSGSDHSADSAYLVLKGINILKSSNYVIPVRIKTITGDNGASLSIPASIVYVHIILSDVIQTTLSISGGNLTNNTLGLSSTDNNITNLYALLNQSLTVNVNATIVADTSLIKNYNAVNLVNYIALPAGTFKLSGSQVTIASGNTQSTTAVQFQLTNSSSLNPNNDYLLPVKISSFSGSPDIDFGTEIIYIHVSVTNIDASGALIQGTLINRSSPAWAASATASSPANPPGGVLDGDPTTDWESGFTGLPQSIIIDMLQSHSLTGISYIPSYAYFSFGIDISPTDVIVYTSSDGNNWTRQGEYLPVATNPNSSPSSPDVKNIKFYNPVSARYFKLTILHSAYYDFTAGISEINAYQ